MPDGRVVVDLSLISENTLQRLQEAVSRHLGKTIGVHILIEDVKDTNTITDIKAHMHSHLCIHSDWSRFRRGSVMLQDGVQIREINDGVQVNSGFTLKLKASDSLFHDQTHIFFDAVFLSGFALLGPHDELGSPLSIPDDPAKANRKRMSDNPAKAKRKRISKKPSCA